MGAKKPELTWRICWPRTPRRATRYLLLETLSQMQIIQPERPRLIIEVDEQLAEGGVARVAGRRRQEARRRRDIDYIAHDESLLSMGT